MPFTVLRYGIPYGPRMREELLIPVFIRKALAGQPLTVAGRGDQYRKFVYVPITVLEVAEGVRRVLGDCVRIEFVPERPGDFGGKDVSGAKALRELGWEPRVELEEGLRRTIDWFRGRQAKAGGS